MQNPNDPQIPSPDARVDDRGSSIPKFEGRINKEVVPPDSGYFSPARTDEDCPTEVFSFDHQQAISRPMNSGDLENLSNPEFDSAADGDVYGDQPLTASSNQDSFDISSLFFGSEGGFDFDNPSNDSPASLSPVYEQQTANGSPNVLDMTQSAVYLRRKSRSDPNLPANPAHPQGMKTAFSLDCSTSTDSDSCLLATFAPFQTNRVFSSAFRPAILSRFHSLDPPGGSPRRGAAPNQRVSTPSYPISRPYRLQNRSTQTEISQTLSIDHPDRQLEEDQTNHATPCPDLGAPTSSRDGGHAIPDGQEAGSQTGTMPPVCLNCEVPFNRSGIPSQRPVVAVAPFNASASTLPLLLQTRSSAESSTQASYSFPIHFQLARSRSRAVGRRLAAIGDRINEDFAPHNPISGVIFAVFEAILRVMRLLRRFGIAFD